MLISYPCIIIATWLYGWTMHRFVMGPLQRRYYLGQRYEEDGDGGYFKVSTLIALTNGGILFVVPVAIFVAFNRQDMPWLHWSHVLLSSILLITSWCIGWFKEAMRAQLDHARFWGKEEWVKRLTLLPPLENSRFVRLVSGR